MPGSQAPPKLKLKRSVDFFEMVVSLDRGDPNLGPKVLESFLWGPPKKGTPDFGKPHVRASILGMNLGTSVWALELPCFNLA